jgi:thiol-disulfide isomerase/thioredoxin/outer membrane lipoprotein-sorting protein
MNPIFLRTAATLALALPLSARADDKADAIVAEVSARAKTLTAFSAQLTMRIIPLDPKAVLTEQTMKGSLLMQGARNIRFQLGTPQGSMLVLVNEGSAYNVTGTQYIKIPAAAASQVGKRIWPPLLGSLADFVGGIKETKYVTQKMLDEATVVDVVDITGQEGTARIYVDRDSLVRKVRMNPPGSFMVQEIELSQIDTEPTIPPTAFALPPGLTEKKVPQGGEGGGLDEKLVALGKTPPAFNLATPNGAKLSLASVRAGKKATLINFWFVGCPPCRAEFPELQKLYTKHKSSGFAIVAVNQGDDDKSINGFLKEKGISFPVVKGIAGTFEAYGVQAYPTNYLLDGNGKIVYRSVGFDESGLKAALKKLGFK